MTLSKKKGNLLIYWDYELQKGMDTSFLGNKSTGYDEYENTKKALKLLKKYDIKNTFAVLGHAALKGKLPYHSPEQIKIISEENHEIASHTQNHEFIPDISFKHLLNTLMISKYNIEKVIKKKIHSFVPPYNMPSEYFNIPLALKSKHFPKISKISINQVAKALSITGYKTYRAYYFKPLSERILNKSYSKNAIFIKDILTFKMCCRAGFTSHAKEVVIDAIKNKKTAVIYAHPCGLSSNGAENIKYFESFLKFIKKYKDKNMLDIETPYEIYKKIKNEN